MTMGIEIPPTVERVQVGRASAPVSYFNAPNAVGIDEPTQRENKGENAAMIKLFISHAWEDKEDFVEPLAKGLSEDFDVRYDKDKLTLGDRMLASIDQGLSSCDYGVVVLSHNFFSKHWTREELEGLFALETKKRKVILPVWKDVTADDVRKFSPILVHRYAVSADQGIEYVVDEIKKAVQIADRVKRLESAWEEKLAELDKDVAHGLAARSRSNTPEGVQQVYGVARKIIAEAKDRVENWNQKKDSLELGFTKDPIKSLPDSLSILGPFIPYSPSAPKPQRLSLRFAFLHARLNSLEDCSLVIDIIRLGSYVQDDPSQGTLEEFEFIPKFDREFNIYWQDRERRFSSGRAVLDFVFDRFVEILRNDVAEVKKADMRF